MQIRHKETFATIRTEGSILPADLLQRIAEGKGIEGLDPSDYHLSEKRLNEAINRSWNHLLATWVTFKAAISQLSEKDLGTGATRERWLLPLFQELGYGRLLVSKAVEIDRKSYPISHSWHRAPIHLLGFRLSIDKKVPGAVGAARMSPHGLMQEYLNRSDGHLWGFVSNGLRLRILRDSASLTKQSYVEFDLEGMMDGEVYSDFVLFWLLCHESRLEADKPEECWLEKWSKEAEKEGTRALEHLRSGVEKAIEALGRGFLSHPGNSELKDKLRNGVLDKQEYYRQILRLVYRLILLFVAEDRGILLSPEAEPKAMERYSRYYSLTRLRKLAERKMGTRHSDLYQGLCLVMEKLGSDQECPEVGLSPFGSFLFSSGALKGVDGCNISNRDLLEAIRSLTFITYDHFRRPVDYKHIGSEELGSVYESLLELHPELNIEAGEFSLRTASGHERKTTGSYYTPSSLVQCLLDSALDPVLDEVTRKDDPEEAILDLKVCDPACGSGHFLVAAAHRIAKRLAAIRTGDDEPSPDSVRKALRDVVGHCIYGVDLNPMAVELCKVSLWMEAIEPGKPLSFLDHRIQCGNSLLGTTPKLISNGIPDEAFMPIEGDEKAWVAALKKRNKQERSGQLTMFATFSKSSEQAALANRIRDLNKIKDDSVAAIHQKEKQYEQLTISAEFQKAKLTADAWCSAFVWKKHKGAPPPITHDIFRHLAVNPATLPTTTLNEINRLSEQYAFLHWHIVFPDVFRAVTEGKEPVSSEEGWNGGFDVVLGNPPWERIKLQEKEWFAGCRPDIANAPNAAKRRKMIEALKEEDLSLYVAFLEDRRKAEGESHIVRNSGRYPLCGRGDINTYAVFAETKRFLISPTGRVGCIVPSGIATDDTTKYFFQDLMKSNSLASLYDFENSNGIFSGVHRSYKFCLLTITGISKPVEHSNFVFFAYNVDDINKPGRKLNLSFDDLALLNPVTQTCPVLRTVRDYELLKRIHIYGVQLDSKSWNGFYIRLIHLGDHADSIRLEEHFQYGHFDNIMNYNDAEKCYLRIYEAKLIHHFDHRYATFNNVDSSDAYNGNARYITFSEHSDPHYSVKPRYWVEADFYSNIVNKYSSLSGWFLAYRDIARATDERTCIATAIPETAATVSVPCIGTQHSQLKPLLQANLSSFCLDYSARQKVAGIHLNFTILKQLPIIASENYSQPLLWSDKSSARNWLIPRILELTYTAWDLEPFAKDCSYNGPPFRWDESRRFVLRCELDAAYFHLYGIERDDVDYIMETFPIVKRKDEQQYGEYRTKRVILEIYDEMAQAKRSGRPYQTRLDPPPADPRVAHPPKGLDSQ